MSEPIRDGERCAELDVQVVVRASRDEIVGVHENRVKVRLSAPPVEGEANKSLVKMLANRLGIPKRDLEIVRGSQARKKTLRAHGVDAATLRSRLGLAAIMALSSACAAEDTVPIRVVLPADTDDLERADNASLVLRPDEIVVTQAIDGTDFQLDFVFGEPSESLHTVELYLADGEELLAWGSTVPFPITGADLGVALFVGQPGGLSTWPEVVDDPEPDILVAHAPGRGMLLVEPGGATFLLNELTLEVEAGSTLDVDLDGTDGGLFTASDDALVRMTWRDEAPAAWRYDPGEDEWSELVVQGADEIGPRPFAPVLEEPDHSKLYMLGGGDSVEPIAIALQPNEDDILGATTVTGVDLDSPRQGGFAVWIPDGEDLVASALVVGGNADDEPVVHSLTDAWSSEVGAARRDMACAIDPRETDDVRVVCFGGLVDDAASSEMLFVRTRAGDDEGEVEMFSDALPEPVAAPLAWNDGIAAYAQGAGRLFTVDPDDELVDAPGSPLRHAGGHSVELATGARFLVGGVGTADAPVERWQVFTPAVPDTD